MTCYITHMPSGTECGTCAGELAAAGYAAVTDEIEVHAAFVAVCEGCTSGLRGLDAALGVRDRWAWPRFPKRLLYVPGIDSEIQGVEEDGKN